MSEYEICNLIIIDINIYAGDSQEIIANDVFFIIILYKKYQQICNSLYIIKCNFNILDIMYNITQGLVRFIGGEYINIVEYGINIFF